MSVEHNNNFQIGAVPIRTATPKGFDAALLTLRARKPLSILKLPRHLARHNRPNEYTYINPPVITFKDRLDALRTIREDVGIPFEVWQTFMAEVKYGCKELDPGVFTRITATHAPADKELSKWKLEKEDLVLAQRSPPILAGSLLMVEYDPMDSNSVWMRKANSGPYKGRLSIGGGHFDNIGEIAAFEEAKEEAGVVSFHTATPLGVADQGIAIQKAGQPVELRRYHNYMWEVDVPYEFKPKSLNPLKPWERIYDDGFEEMQAEGMLTPIAECALKVTRVLL